MDSKFNWTVRSRAILLRYALGVFLSLASCMQQAEAASSPRERILFDRNWRFQHGDAPGAEAPSFDDSGWRQLNLPHDWMIEGVKGAKPEDMDGPFDKGSWASAGGAYLNGGIGWYRQCKKSRSGRGDGYCKDGRFAGKDRRRSG